MSLLAAPTARSRSLVKAITWRMVGSLDTFMLSFLIVYFAGHQAHAGSAAKIGGTIALVETGTKIILYFFHERIWAHVPWGRADREVAAHPEAAESPAL